MSDALENDEWRLRRLCHKFEMVRHRRRGGPDFLDELGGFVEKRLEYPPEVAIAALEALVNVDAGTSALTDDDWCLDEHYREEKE